MEERAAAAALRQVFADLTTQGGWDGVERNEAARSAVRNFVDDARATGMRVEDVIVEAVAITGAASSNVRDPQLEQIVRWVVADFFSREFDEI
jgi:hypothetical protein